MTKQHNPAEPADSTDSTTDSTTESAPSAPAPVHAEPDGMTSNPSGDTSGDTSGARGLAADEAVEAAAPAEAPSGDTVAAETTPGEGGEDGEASQDNTTLALGMADLAEAAHQTVAGTSETQPVPIVTGTLRPLDSTPRHGAPKIPFPPPSFIPEDDPNATNQIAASGGLTGLDVLGGAGSSSGLRMFLAQTVAEAGGIADEIGPGWAVADQPTMAMPPRPASVSSEPSQPSQPSEPRAPAPPRPAFLETGEQDVWPPRPNAAASEPGVDDAPSQPYQPTPNPRPIPRPATRPVLPHERLGSPTGRRPLGNADAAYSDPRMRRYVELRMQRGAHEHGQRGPADRPPVAQMVRQWWNDLMPGLGRALDHQHEARASGVYPLPAHEAEPSVATTRLGDVFGRLAAAVRDLGERAQSAAMPALTRLHEGAERAAQAIVGKLEGPQVRQQAPFLGPGRLAVFFRQGVTVGQAQRLLLVHRAQPMRLIPRKHGFLARVIPGREAEVGAELRQHPYVRDVVYLEYDKPVEGEAAAGQ